MASAWRSRAWALSAAIRTLQRARLCGGYVHWTHTLDIHEPGEQLVDVPALTRAPAVVREPQRAGAVTAPRKRPQQPRTARNHRLIARSEETSPIPTSFWVAGGTGIVATGLVAVFGGLSLSSYAKAEDSCPGRRACSDSALDARDRAGTQARIANISAAVAITQRDRCVLYFDSRGKRPRQKAASRSVRTPTRAFEDAEGCTRRSVRSCAARMPASSPLASDCRASRQRFDDAGALDSFQLAAHGPRWATRGAAAAVAVPVRRGRRVARSERQ